MIQKIIGSFDIKPDDHIIEIGPGRGALTQPLSDSRCDLTLIEIDRDLAAELSVRFPDAGLINQDVMTIDFNMFAGKPLIRIIGNLPYNISTHCYLSYLIPGNISTTCTSCCSEKLLTG